MPSVTSATALRIQCTNPECETQIVYPLQTVKLAPTSCPVCDHSWGDGIQTFRDALDVQRKNGSRKYKTAPGIRSGAILGCLKKGPK